METITQEEVDAKFTVNRSQRTFDFRSFDNITISVSDLQHVKFNGCTFTDCNLDVVTAFDCDFIDCDLRGLDFGHTEIIECSFKGSKLSLKKIHLRFCNLLNRHFHHNNQTPIIVGDVLARPIKVDGSWGMTRLQPGNICYYLYEIM